MKRVATYIAIASVMIVAAASAQDRGDKHHHKNLSCAACHGEQAPTAVRDLLCTNCHGSPQDTARKTAGLKLRNPHTSIHFGTSLPCEECHKQHRASYNYCIGCHRTWPDTLPGM